MVTLQCSPNYYPRSARLGHVLASLHFNENLRRKTKKTKGGKSYIDVLYPKFKMGGEVIKEVFEPPTYQVIYIEFGLMANSVELTRARVNFGNFH